MKELLLVANWKSNLTETEIKSWFATVASLITSGPIPSEKKVIICPSFVYLPLVKKIIADSNLPFSVGAQDISPFGNGAYTGEVNGKQIAEYATHVVIGHSERRQNFPESEENLIKKVELAKQNNLQVLYCISNVDERVPAGVDVIAYEPIDAISTSGGNALSPVKANEVAKILGGSNKPVLYGGSVTSDNVKDYTSGESIAGILVGGASLNPTKFFTLIQHA